MPRSDGSAQSAESEVLTREQRQALRCECWVGHHVRFCPVPEVEKIIATATADALQGARDDIKARIQTFRGLKAEQMYLNALNDAWGLVANRERDARRAADAIPPPGCGCSCTCEGKTHHWASCQRSSPPEQST